MTQILKLVEAIRNDPETGPWFGERLPRDYELADFLEGLSTEEEALEWARNIIEAAQNEKDDSQELGNG